MAEHALQLVLKPYQTLVHSIQNHLSHFIGDRQDVEIPKQAHPLIVRFISKPIISLGQDDDHSLKPVSSFDMGHTSKPLSKEDLGRATWTLLHSIAAQYPDHPTRQEKRDVNELMAILSRLYPCKECGSHFHEILKTNPVQAGSQVEFSQWLCRVHNVVNRSLGKVFFPCQRVDARWGKLECKGRGCDLHGTDTNFS